MKHALILYALLCFATVPVSSVSAQATSKSGPEYPVKADGKYAILADDERHFRGAVMTGQQLKAEHPDIQFEVVLVGGIIKELAGNEDLRNLVVTAEKEQTHITACGFAMERLDITKEQLPASVGVTPNAYTYLFGLQEAGFKVLTP